MSTLPCVCYNTNTNDDRNRLAILTKKLQKNFKVYTQILDALVATALASDRLAAHWLVNHADDPCLTAGNPREYFLLLCPVDELEDRLTDFWAAYQVTRGWSATMDRAPGVALLRPFEALACSLVDVYHAFNTVSRFYADRCPAGDFRLALPPPSLPSPPPSPSGEAARQLELAFHLGGVSVEALLAEVAAKFVELLDAAGGGVRAEPLAPPFRLPLCQDFSQTQHMQIVQEVESHFGVHNNNKASSADGASCCVVGSWQLRLYSRDVRLRNDLTGETHAVYRMQSECLQFEQHPTATAAADSAAVYAGNCLAYSAGDLVALVAPATPQRHGWALGLNCETGELGHFQVLGGRRVPNSSVWTLHKVANFGFTAPVSPLGNSASSSCWASFSRQSSIGGGPDESSPAASMVGGCGGGGGGGGGCRQHHSVIGQYHPPPSDASGGSSDSAPPSPKPSTPAGKSKSFTSFFLSERRPRRQLHVMRHGERLDTSVGFNWFTKAFDQKGVFANRFDLNIPELLPTRPAEDFDHDTPLTLIGQFVSYQLGEALARAGVHYNYAYSSPALRCVQTAHFLLSGAGQSCVGVRIEPLLNEFPYDDCVQMPNFMTAAQLRQSGYNVDTEYKPHSTLDGFDRCNTPEKYQHRLNKVLKKVLESTRKRGGGVLIVGHRTTLEFCPSLLLDRKACARRLCIPYNAMLCLDERPKKAGWALGSCHVRGFTVSEHSRFDGSSLLGASI